MKQVKRCLIIIPAYNEEKNIGNVLKEVTQLYPEFDVLVVDDGSSDNTGARVLLQRVKMITHPFNLKYGSALQTGFKYAVVHGYSFVVQFDADGQHDPQDIRTIIKVLEMGQADIVIGSRFLGKSSYRTGFLKKTAIVLFRMIIRAATGVRITDPSSGLQGLTRRAFSYYALTGHYPADYPDADVLIQMILNGFRVCEFPADIRARESGQSMHSGIKPVYYLIKMLVSIMVVLLRPRTATGRDMNDEQYT